MTDRGNEDEGVYSQYWRVRAVHPHWEGFLLLSNIDNALVHEDVGSRGTYDLSSGQLNVAWEQNYQETYVNCDGFWVENSLVPVKEMVELQTAHVPETRETSVIADEGMTPRKIYFVLVSEVSGGHYEIPLVYYIAMKSALLINKGYEVYLHTNVQPCGSFWHSLRSQIRLEACSMPEEVFGIRIEKVHHKVDVLRLQILIQHGGVYLDLDTICLRPFDALLDHIPVMGREGPSGLCNAVIISPVGAEFLLKWMDGYRDFHNSQWNEFSVLLPMKIAQKFPGLVRVEPEPSFFIPSFNDESLLDLFDRNKTFPNAYIYHLWGYLSKRYVQGLTLGDILLRDTTYNVAARRVVTAPAAPGQQP